MGKGEKPWTTKYLAIKLNAIWLDLASWRIFPLGNGFFEFLFECEEDKRKVRFGPWDSTISNRGYQDCQNVSRCSILICNDKHMYNLR